jgi:hypothetical protein
MILALRNNLDIAIGQYNGIFEDVIADEPILRTEIRVTAYSIISKSIANNVCLL